MINNAFYDELEEDWYASTNHPIALLRAENRTRNPWIEKKIAESFQLPCDILDIGCGAGFLTNALSLSGHRVTGIDMSEKSLSVAKRWDKTQNVRYLCKDAYQLPFKDESFDVVCAMDFLEHVDRPEQILAEASRVLRPGGLFFFHTFNRNPLSYVVVIKGVEWCVPNTPPNMHVYPLFIKPKELKNWCAQKGITVEEMHGFTPKFLSLPFLKSFFSRKVDDELSFCFTRSLLTGYVGFGKKINPLNT